MTRTEAAETIEDFLSGRGGKWNWDEFISLRLDDASLDAVRRLCARLPEIDPPSAEGSYCGQRGFTILADLVRLLRSGGDLGIVDEGVP